MREEESALSNSQSTGGPPASATPPRSDSIQVQLKDTAEGGKMLTIEHPSLLRSGTFAIDSSDGELTLQCGNLQVQIRDLDHPEQVCRLNEQQQSSASVDNSTDSKPRKKRKVNEEGKTKESSKKDERFLSEESLKAILSINLRISKGSWEWVNLTCRRGLRIEEVERLYAKKTGLDVKELRLEKFDGTVPAPGSRLGSFVGWDTPDASLRMARCYLPKW